MTYSLKLQSGDLAAQGSQLAIVSGSAKLQQDVSLWLLERFGCNRMHPQFGSVLQNYIGTVITATTQTNVYNEVLRVLTNYQEMVYELFRANPGAFSLSELPYSVDPIRVNMQYDAVYVSVTISNPATTTTVHISPTSL